MHYSFRLVEQKYQLVQYRSKWAKNMFTPRESMIDRKKLYGVNAYRIPVVHLPKLGFRHLEMGQE